MRKNFKEDKHMKKASFVLLAALIFGLGSASLQAQGKFDGYMVPEYYMYLSSSNKDLEGSHGLWFRRIYFTYNNAVTDGISMRFRLEMNSPGNFTSTSALTPYVKDAYLRFKLAGQTVSVGLQGPPTYEQVESVWGHRPLEKTPLDHFGLRSSRDMGVSIAGNLDEKKTIGYTMMYGIGNAGGETNKGKMLYGALSFKPVKGMFIEFYGDYEKQTEDRTFYVYQGFVSYSGDFGRFGFLYANKNQDIAGATRDYGMVSGFAVIKGGEKLEIIGRYDKCIGDGWEKGFSGGRAYFPFPNNVKTNYIIAGVSYLAAKNVWIIPNIKYAFFDKPENRDAPDAHMWANFTLYFKF